MTVRLEPSWKNLLQDEFTKDYWFLLTTKVKSDYLNEKVYPAGKNIFRAFDLSPLNETKVVILGQDPYHGVDQANGLAFSVNKNIPPPPSLKNIFKEIESDLGVKTLNHGDLSRWANQGVLLLNSVLTVLAKKPASHSGIGWEQFTDKVISILNENKKHVVYMLWGKYAQRKGEIINRKENLVLESGHPSPYSAKLFFNNKHFSKCNQYLKRHCLEPIDWR